MGWNDVKKNSQKGDFLKLKNGQKVNLHILTDEPVTSYQIYDNDLRQGANVPEGYKLPEPLRPRVQHSFVVYNLDEKIVQILSVSQTTAEKFAAVFEAYENTFQKCDIQLKRDGDGLDTEYHPTAVPLKYTPDMTEGYALPDLNRVFGVSDEETIQAVIPGALAQAEKEKKERDAKKAKKEGKKAETTAAAKATTPTPAPAQQHTTQAPASDDLGEITESKPEPQFAPVGVVKDFRDAASRVCPKCQKEREFKEGTVKAIDAKSGKPWGRVKVIRCAPCNTMEVAEKLPDPTPVAA